MPMPANYKPPEPLQANQIKMPMPKPKAPAVEKKAPVDTSKLTLDDFGKMMEQNGKKQLE